MLGVGESPVVVDNAASCVIACVNTQRRGRAVQAAGDVLTWSAVAEQVADADDEERGEVGRQLSAAERRLRDEVARAFQHYAYLTRNEGGLRSSSGGSTVTERPASTEPTSGDSSSPTAEPSSPASSPPATSGPCWRPSHASSPLARSCRASTRTPGFPSSTAPERSEACSPIWSQQTPLPTADGNSSTLPATASTSHPLTRSPSTPSHRPCDRRSRLPPTHPATHGKATTPSDGQSRPAFGQPAAPIAVTNDPTASDFKRYIVDLPNRSLRGTDERERVWRLIRELAKIIDPARDDLRHELLSLRIELNTVAGHQGDLEQRATEADARVRVEDDDF